MAAGDNPKVSVIVPAFRTASTLAAAVDSVLRQTLQDFEVIIVEDQSRDDTLDVARMLEHRDRRIRVLPLTENRGQAHALNYGTARAAGTWIATLDADDTYREQRLEVLLRAGEAHGADLVADNQDHIDETAGVLVRTAFPVSEGGRQITLQDFIDNNSAEAEFSFGILKPVIRRDYIRTHRLAYREGLKLGQDFYHLMQFFAAGGTAYLVHQPYYAWTLPFGPVSREWTKTGLGAWRYDYTGTLEANRDFIALMRQQGQAGLVALLERRAKEYRTMIHYLAAQKILAETGSMLKAARIISAHPSTWGLLTKRISGRLTRAVRYQ